MRRATRWSGSLLILCLFGCGQNNGDKHKALMEDFFKEMENVTEVLKSVKDISSARLAAPKLRKAANRVKELAEQAKKLPDLTKEEAVKIMEEMEGRRDKIVANHKTYLLKALEASDGANTFESAVRELADAFDSFIKH